MVDEKSTQGSEAWLLVDSDSLPFSCFPDGVVGELKERILYLFSLLSPAADQRQEFKCKYFIWEKT